MDLLLPVIMVPILVEKFLACLPFLQITIIIGEPMHAASKEEMAPHIPVISINI